MQLVPELRAETADELGLLCVGLLGALGVDLVQAVDLGLEDPVERSQHPRRTGCVPGAHVYKYDAVNYLAQVDFSY